MRRSRPALALFALPLLLAAAPESSPQPERPRVGLVLSGGGARGAAHIGVLRVLEDLHVPVDVIVGTSMGSIVGGLYAAGMSVDELETTLASVDWGQIFSDRPPRSQLSFRRKEDDADLMIRYKVRFRDGKPRLPLGIIQGQRLDTFLKAIELSVTDRRDFDRLPIPYRAVAADLETGEAVVLSEGSLATAMRASMSVPGAFPPVELNGRFLVDGGVASNLPIHVAKDLGVDVVIAVDISTPLSKLDEVESVLDVAGQLSGMLTKGNVQREMQLLTDDDIFIQPDLGDIKAADFGRAREAIPLGEVAAREQASRLGTLAVPADTWAAFEARHQPSVPAQRIITEVRLDNRTPISDKVIRSHIDARPGAPLDAERLRADLVDLYGLAYFEPIEFDLLPMPGGYALLVTVRENREGLAMLQFGLNIEDDFQGGSRYGLRARHTLLAVNGRGGEWRNDLQIGDLSRFATEFYQPLDRRLRYFVAPELAYEQDTTNIVIDGQALAEARVKAWGATVDVGRTLGNWGELRLGLLREEGRAEIRVGFPVDPVAVSVTQAVVRLRVDTLDSPAWPRSGGRGEARLEKGLEGLGSDNDDSRLQVGIEHAFSFGRHTLVPAFTGGFAIEGRGNTTNTFNLGGFLLLSGYEPRELSGTEAVLGRLQYYRRLNRSVGRLAPRFYLSASVEAGNVYGADEPMTFDSLLWGGSLGIGADTPLGPLFLGYGYSEPDRDRFYLFIGTLGR